MECFWKLYLNIIIWIIILGTPLFFLTIWSTSDKIGTKYMWITLVLFFIYFFALMGFAVYGTCYDLDITIIK